MSQLTIKPFALKLIRSSNVISVFTIKAKIRLNGRIGKTAFPIHEPDLDKVLIKKVAQKARMMQPGNTLILERSFINPLFMELWKRATLEKAKAVMTKKEVHHEKKNLQPHPEN